MQRLRAGLDPRARRANLLVSGVGLVRTRGILRVGPVLLRIKGETTPCEQMEDAHAGLQMLMRERWGGGAYADVLQGGDIRVSDVVAWQGLTFAVSSPYSPNFEEASMDEKALFLKFWKKEAPATRAVISRIPEGSDYRPDPKSRTAREIAWLIVREEIALADGLEKGRFDWEEVPAPATAEAIIAEYDGNHDSATARLDRLTTAQLERDVPFVFGGQEVMRSSGFESAWGFLFDIIHHRGQLSTYLRPMGSKVPQIYGPSADEP